MSWVSQLSTKGKVLLGLGLYFATFIAFLLIFPSEGKNEHFQPQDEFKLDAWIPIKIGGIDLSINRAVFYLALASALTIWVLVWISRRMTMEPNRVQTSVEVAYDLTKKQIVGTNLEGRLAIKWFPFIATLFFFLWFSNIIGYLPLPTNTQETVDIFGIAFPSFAIYAATANISIPLALTLVVWVSYHLEGIRTKSFFKYERWRPDPLILDDQALVMKVRGRGLVLLTGCGHSGIVNILRYARRLTGEDRLHAVVGGFHLGGPLFEKIIAPTCEALDEFSPDYIVPSHCTGWRATHAIAARFPEAFIQNSVGTRFEFAAGT